MSGATTPSSGGCSPASSQSPDRTPDSDTTPSPSGGKRSPSFNPHRLSSKLALLEASQSLAYAAETLSVAAKAMSKASASLSVASGHQDHDFEYNASAPGARELSVRNNREISQDWQESSYTLSTPNTSFGTNWHEVVEGASLTTELREWVSNIRRGLYTPEPAY